MDADRFEEVVSEGRSTRYDEELNIHSDVIEKKLEYRPYVECPRCSNWKLAAHVHEKRHKVSRGFLRGSYHEWRATRMWWECKECAGTFDVLTTEDVAAEAAEEVDDDAQRVDNADELGEDAEAAGGEADAADSEDEPRHYDIELTNESWSKAPIPVDGGEKGIILKPGIVNVPAVDAEFQLPEDADLSEGTELWIEREGDEVYCIEDDSPA